MSGLQVTIDHPTGVWMKYSESLGTFLLNERPETDADEFQIGQWLSTLTDAEMKELVRLGEAQNSGRPIPGQHPDAADDFLQVAIIAFGAEQGARPVEHKPEDLTLEAVTEIVRCLNVCVALEHLCREGFIELHGMICIDPEGKPPQLTVTDKGLEAGAFLATLN